MIELEKEVVNNFVIQRSLVVAVGIPAYNEEKTIAKVVLGAQKFVDNVIVCDDGSADLTGEIAKRLGAIVIRHEKNLGYGAALQSILKRARELNADVLVTIDADGQHDPAEIPLLIKPLAQGTADVVLGSRFKDSKASVHMPLYRRLGIKAITRLSKGSVKVGITDSQSGFRAYNKFALEHLSLTDNGMSASLELLSEISKNNLRVVEVPITCKYKKELGVETSTQNPIKHGLSLVVSLIRVVVEEKPLLFMGLPGIIALTIGIAFSAWLIDIYASAGYIVTNIALASIGFLFLGCFMISTAITLYAISRVSKHLMRR